MCFSLESPSWIYQKGLLRHSTLHALLHQRWLFLWKLANAQILRPFFHVAAMAIVRAILFRPGLPKLFYEEGHILLLALVAQLASPVRIEVPRTSSALATNDHLIDPCLVQRWQRTKERLTGEELDMR